MPEPLACKFEQGGDIWHWSAEKPEGATKLYVDFKPAGQSFPQVKLPLEKTSAQQNLQKANETFAFNPVAEFTTDQNWQGSINKPGTLRLIAIAPHKIYVTAKKIEFASVK